MGSQKSRDITKKDLIAWVICAIVIFVLVYLHECGYDVGAIIATCVLLFFVVGVFHNRKKNVAIEYPADWDDIRQRVMQRDSFTCSNCSATNTIMHVHHVVPITRGGTSIDSNLITLCEGCHKAIHPHMR